MSNDLKNRIKQLERKLKLSQQALSQNSSINKKYNDALNLLKEKEHFTHTIIESNKNAIIAINENQIVTIFNKSAEEMFGYLKQEMLSRDSLHNIMPKHLFHKHLKAATNFLETKKSCGLLNSYVELEGKRKDNTLFPIRIGFGVAVEKDGIIIIANIEDITSEKKALNELSEQKEVLSYQAHHDALTNLPNRVLFIDRLERAIQTAKRSKTDVALLFIDLDRFKEINDSLGHAVGDEILKIVASRLKETLREEDTISRFGGDEFTILIEGLTKAQDASLTATKILNVLSKPMNEEGNVLYISSSIGISIYPDDGETAGELLKYADAAMHKAKDEGRNNYQYYNHKLTELAFERVVMETSLREALQEEQFVVYYQAQVDGARDKIIGMEALVRWQHPAMGLVPPDKFIPLAESTGLIVALDRIVMRRAMTQMARWYKDGLNPGVIAINLAMKQLHQEDFLEMLKNLMQETGCRAEWIELEVTEGQIMKNPNEAIKLLTQINDLGIELAVDDFGTGYSSLAYLKRLPIDKLKIDQAFVRGLPDDEEDSAIAKAVIALAKSLNLRVIAEGAETKEQKDFLVENGCINIQGYYYSKPIPADEFEVLLVNGL